MSESKVESAEAVVEESGFAKMGLDPRLLSALGYKNPSPIQREAIPVLLEGRDLVGLAGTGTGKTAAFALPILHRLATREEKEPGVSALVLTPTRELAMQVAKAVKKYGQAFKVEVLAVYGGTGFADQVRAIRRGVDVIVATPGRALDLIKQGKLPLDSVSTVVLDEADEMLNMGFAEDMDAILSQTPKDRQTMLFSATMPPRIEEISKRHLRKPARIQVAKEVPAGGEGARVRQTAYYITRDSKTRALCRVLDLEQPASAIIFCRTRSEADELVDLLNKRGFKPLALHGGLSQPQRDQVMGRFRSGTADLLVATDIAARGLDIAHLSHVINYDLPADPDQYIHRIGRVGRAGRTGVAITFATAREQSGLTQIERATKQKIAILPIPTVKDLEASRIDRTRQQLLEALKNASGSEGLRKLVDELSQEFTPADVAFAALSLLRQPTRPDDDADFGGGSQPKVSGKPGEFKKGRDNSRDFKQDRERPGKKGPGRSAGGKPPAGDAKHNKRPRNSHGMAKVYFGIGSDSGVAARDLVGAIANEAGIAGQDIGSIDVTDRFALVEVHSSLAHYVVEAMQGVKIRGRRVDVRADRPAVPAAMAEVATVEIATAEDRVPLGV
jgi:ATP-dependent RNA helicase DeaD